MNQDHNNMPQKSLFIREDEDTKRPTQLQTIFHYLMDNIATASMVSEATGVYQKNICRYKRDLEKAGLIWEIEKKHCKKTGFRAWYLTTNPDFVPDYSDQLSLF